MKRFQIKRRPLADSVLSSLEPEDIDYQERDSQGLYFRVKATGTKSWILRYKTPAGKWTQKGLGGYPAVSGKQARAKAAELLQRLSDGLSVSPEPEHVKDLDLTVTELSALFFEHKQALGRKEQTLSQLNNMLYRHICPVLGDRSVKEVTRL